MISFTYHFHQVAEYLEIVLLGWKSRRMFQEKRDYCFSQIISAGYLVAIAVLMIGAFIFLEVNVPAAEVFLQIIENGFILLYQLDVEPRFGLGSSLHIAARLRTCDMNRETAFAVYQTDYVFREHHLMH